MACTPDRHDDRRQQGRFRILLQAISRPGRLFRFEDAMHSWPALALAECLLDNEVGFFVAGDDRDGYLKGALRSTTGASPQPIEHAAFLFVLGPRSDGVARSARRGSAEYPEEGATIVYCLDRDQTPADRPPDSERFRVRLSGPGIAEPEGVAPEMRGLDLGELRELQTVNADYPLGVEAFFLRANGELMALPRSTRIQVR